MPKNNQTEVFNSAMPSQRPSMTGKKETAMSLMTQSTAKRYAIAQKNSRIQMRACLKSLNEKNNMRRKTEALECPRHLERMQRNSAAATHLEGVGGGSSTA